MTNLKGMTPEQKEAFHRDAESRVVQFHYEKPTGGRGPKDWTTLCKPTFPS